MLTFKEIYFQKFWRWGRTEKSQRFKRRSGLQNLNATGQLAFPTDRALKIIA